MITDDEFSVLMIAAEGQYMLAIGRWELPTKSLEKKGMLKCEILAGGPQYTITEVGREAIAAREQAETAELKSLVNRGTTLIGGIRGDAERAAQYLAKAAKASEQVNGDAPEVAAKHWSESILVRALEILRG